MEIDDNYKVDILQILKHSIISISRIRMFTQTLTFNDQG